MRVTTVKKAQKDAGRCLACHNPVLKGESYRWAAAFRSPRMVRHVDCGPFRSSELASNDKLAELYSAQEAIEDWIAGTGPNDEFTLEDAKTVMEEAADAVEAAAEMYEESASAIEDGFGHSTTQSEEMSDHAEECNDWAQTLRDALDSMSEFGDDDDDSDGETEVISDEDKALKLEAWRQDVLSAMSDAANECPL